MLIEAEIISRFSEEQKDVDLFSHIRLLYTNGIVEVTGGRGVKSEGEFVISGTKGYIYVPAPWWKTEYFEVRYEDPEENQHYFYQLEGEGIRYELVDFAKTVNSGTNSSYIEPEVSEQICEVMRRFYGREGVKGI